MIDPPARGALVRLLRRRFLRHNAEVLALSGATLVISLLLWATVYAAAAWLTLVSATVVMGTQGEEAQMPAAFRRIFVLAAGVLLLAAALRRGLSRNDAPRDRKTFTEHALDLFLAIPATTVAVWSNLSAWLWLNGRELAEAATLLQAIMRENRLPLTSAPVEIPDDDRRERIVLGLLLTGVLDLRRDEGNAYLRLNHAFAKHPALNTTAPLEAAS